MKSKRRYHTLLFYTAVAALLVCPLQKGHAQEAASSNLNKTATDAPVIIDNREASFMRPPAALLPLPEETDLAVPPVPKTAPTPSAAPTSFPTSANEKPISLTPVIIDTPVKASIPRPENLKAELQKTLQEKPTDLLDTLPPAVEIIPPPKETAAVIPAPTPTQTPKPETRPTTEPVIEATALPSPTPEMAGILGVEQGGLGHAMWEGTPRILVERLFEENEVLTTSPTLNNLGRRLLLSTAFAPQGEGKSKRNLLSLRVEKLLDMGLTTDAWNIAAQTDEKLLDAQSLRDLTEASLVPPKLTEAVKKICNKIPDIMDGDTNWQKSLILCQYKNGNVAAAQLGLDLMREQEIQDELFFSLMNKNLLGEAKSLPSKLTPLQPVHLAVLRLTDAPLPSVVYAKPRAVLVPELLKAKTQDEAARLGLAERAASQNLITSAQLAETYATTSFPPESLKRPEDSRETGPKLRAFLYQTMTASMATTPPATEAALADMVTRFESSLEAGLQSGSMAQLLAAQVEKIKPSTELNLFAPTAARLLVQAGKTNQAMVWLKLAKDAAGKIPAIETSLRHAWPLFALAGLVPDADYAPELKAWLNGKLGKSEDVMATPEAKATAKSEAKAPEPLTAQQAEEQNRAAGILVLLAASGFAVPEDAMLRAIEAQQTTRRVAMPSPILLERLRAAGANKKRGEAVLLSVMLARGGVTETPLSVITEIARTLRQVGLAADAQGLVLETAASLLR